MPRSTDTPAGKIREQLIAEIANIRSRKDLSEDGRRRQLARVKNRADKEIRDLAAADRQALETRKQELVTDLFANPTAFDSASNASYRAARAQAATLKTPDEAAALLREARMARDSHLERAVAMRALDQAMGALPGSDDWAAVVDDWSQHQPSRVADALTELSDIQHRTTPTARLSAGLQYALPPVTELAGRDVARLAAEADQNPGEAERDTSTGFESLGTTRRTREQIFGTHYTPEVG